MAGVVLWAEIILAAPCGKIRWVHVLWTAPGLVLAVLAAVGAFSLIASANPSSGEILGLVTVGLLVQLVGFAQETIFRGFVLRGALKSHNVFTAMLISAVLFAPLHVINVLDRGMQA